VAICTALWFYNETKNCRFCSAVLIFFDKDLIVLLQFSQKYLQTRRLLAIFVLAFFISAKCPVFYLRFPYLHFQRPGTLWFGYWERKASDVSSKFGPPARKLFRALFFSFPFPSRSLPSRVLLPSPFVLFFFFCQFFLVRFLPLQVKHPNKCRIHKFGIRWWGGERVGSRF